MISKENDYNPEIQALLISYMLSDTDAFTKCQNIVKPIYFEDRLRPAIRFIQDYSAQYKTLPQLIQVKAATGLNFDGILTSQQHSTWFLDTIESFVRYKALELAVIEGADLVVQGRGGDLERKIKEAMQISLMQDLGLDYFSDPIARLQRMKDNSNYFSTGWKGLDDKLYGGFTQGALNIFAAGSGVGKSLWLQNIALNWARQGKHVVYITLELSEDLVAMRLDAMVTGYATKEIFGNMNDVALKVRMRGMHAGGSLTIKKLPEGGTTANDLRAFLKEYEIKTGHKCDALVVDYLDLMYPNNGRLDPSDLFVKDKYTSEEMRGLITELNLLNATASQLNRQSVEATEFDHSHVSGGISKIMTSDNFFAIFGTSAMKERGEMHIQFLKTRSSAAVGQKLKFKYCPISMLITDADDIEAEQAPKTTKELKEELSDKTDKRNAVANVTMVPNTNSVRSKPGVDVLNLMRQHQAKNNP